MIDLATDMAAVFADPFGFGEAATYTPSGDSGVAVRAMRAAPALVSKFGSAYVAFSIDTFLLLAAEVAQPASGDTLAIGSDTWTLQGVPVQSPDGATWRVEAYRSNAVLLNQSIVLKQGPDKDGAGALDARGRPAQLSDVTSDWPTIATVAAAFDAVRDEEKLRAGIVEAREMARFTVRYSAGLSGLGANDRLIHSGAAWQITGVAETGRQQWLEIAAVKIG